MPSPSPCQQISTIWGPKYRALQVCIIELYTYSPNVFTLRGFWRIFLGVVMCGRGGRDVALMVSCAHAAEIVHDASLPCRRKGHPCHFLETNSIDSAQFSHSPESGPGGSRGAPDAFRGLLGVPPELSGGAPKAPSGILLPGFFLQDSSSEIPPQGILLEDSSSRIPPPGFHL